MTISLRQNFLTKKLFMIASFMIAQFVCVHHQSFAKTKKHELIVVFKKEVLTEDARSIMQSFKVNFREGMDNSKGKIYFAKTGAKYIVTFKSKKEKMKFYNMYKTDNSIYEIYEPDWNIVKD